MINRKYFVWFTYKRKRGWKSLKNMKIINVKLNYVRTNTMQTKHGMCRPNNNIVNHKCVEIKNKKSEGVNLLLLSISSAQSA